MDLLDEPDTVPGAVADKNVPETILAVRDEAVGAAPASRSMSRRPGTKGRTVERLIGANVFPERSIMGKSTSKSHVLDFRR
jgi:hypothetical protein